MMKIFIIFAILALAGPAVGKRPQHRGPPVPQFHEPPGDCSLQKCPEKTRCIVISDPCFQRPCLESTVCVPERKIQPPNTCEVYTCPRGHHCAQLPPASCAGPQCPPPPPPFCQRNPGRHHPQGRR